MPLKCYVIELHVAAPGGMNTPDKVAQGVRWVLEGATVPGVRVVECTGRNCARPDHHTPSAAWLDELLRASAPRS